VQLAELVGIGKSTIERAESGKPLRVDTIQLLCTYFGKDAHELGLLPVLAEAKPGQAAAAALSAQQSTGVTPDASSGTPLSQNRTDGLQRVHPREVEDFVNRHEFLHNAVRVGGAMFFAAPHELLPAELVDRFSSALQRPSTLDAITLNGLKTTTQSYGHLFARGSAPTPALLEATAGHFKLVVQFLQGSLLPSTRSALSAIASETAQLAASLSNHMHLYEQAQAYYNLALITAQEANNDALYAIALGRIGWLMSATNHSQEALVLLAEAQRIALQCDAFALMCWSAAGEAEIHADLAAQANAEQPDDRNCVRSLETVNTWVERIQPTEETFGILFDASRRVTYHGSCYMRLKQPHLARPALLSGLSGPKAVAIFTRGVLLDLATTSIQEQEIEQACSYMHQSLNLILQAHAMKHLHRLRVLREQLEPWAGLQVVKEVDERLMTFQGEAI
jgi:transcriptional regulator with XRE-family HTH domain/tetratricopeptide (TPR) repeat protein